MVELSLIPHLLNKEVYHTYKDYLPREHLKDNFKELWYIYKTLDGVHTEIERNPTIDELEAFFFFSHPDADRSMYEELFNKIRLVDISEEAGSVLLQKIKQKQQALNLSEAALRFATGHGELEKVIDLYKQLEETPDAIEEPQECMDLESILDSAILKSGLRWRLQCLNKSLGSLRDGDFGFIFKRPESGGTAFLASEVGYMLPQAERPIIWINNEESDNKVKLRIYQSYFGVTLEQVIANKKRYNEEFKAKVGRKFQFYGIEYSNRRSIEELVKREKPQLMLYDQLDKVLGFNNDRDDLRLGSIYQWARELCKSGHAAIGVTQADGNAEGVKWLTMQHVANAKTSKQAEADWIIGMGMSHQDGTENVRYLNICKNKLLGDQDSIPDLRHGRFEVWIEKQIMRFKDIVKFE